MYMYFSIRPPWGELTQNNNYYKNNLVEISGYMLHELNIIFALTTDIGELTTH